MGMKARAELSGVWPLPASAEYGKPVVSDGYGKDKRGGRGHFGVDVMYRRPKRGQFARPDRSPWFACPEGTAVLCVSVGTVWSVEDRANGWTIKVDHGAPWLSVYRHVFEPVVEAGQGVEAGDILGAVGFDPMNQKAIRHLHFEVWDTSRGGGWKSQAVDPAPFLRSWRVSL